MQKVCNQVKPLLLNKAKTFLVHCECVSFRCLLFHASAKHQAKSDILSC